VSPPHCIMHQFLLMLLPASTEPVGFFVKLASNRNWLNVMQKVSWHAVAKAPCCKPEGRGFVTR
jgi:hypothetical protein